MESMDGRLVERVDVGRNLVGIPQWIERRVPDPENYDDGDRGSNDCSPPHARPRPTTLRNRNHPSRSSSVHGMAASENPAGTAAGPPPFRQPSHRTPNERRGPAREAQPPGG